MRKCVENGESKARTEKTDKRKEKKRGKRVKGKERRKEKYETRINLKKKQPATKQKKNT